LSDMRLTQAADIRRLQDIRPTCRSGGRSKCHVVGFATRCGWKSDGCPQESIMRLIASRRSDALHY
jgi:hypothetical protein